MKHINPRIRIYPVFQRKKGYSKPKIRFFGFIKNTDPTPICMSVAALWRHSGCPALHHRQRPRQDGRRRAPHPGRPRRTAAARVEDRVARYRYSLGQLSICGSYFMLTLHELFRIKVQKLQHNFFNDIHSTIYTTQKNPDFYVQGILTDKDIPDHSTIVQL